MDENVLVKNLLPCVKQAGSKIIDIYNSKPNAEQKNDGSPVTIADKAAEKIIIKKIKSLYPSIPIVSEENPESHNLKFLSEFFLELAVDDEEMWSSLQNQPELARTVRLKMILSLLWLKIFLLRTESPAHQNSEYPLSNWVKAPR